MTYKVTHHQTFRLDDEGVEEQMANFAAEIIRETHFVDGATRQTTITIRGTQPNPDKPNDDDNPVRLPEIEIDAENFPNLGWVMPNWGVRAVIRPGGSIKDDLRACIQLRSKPEVTTIYRTIGWMDIGGKPHYLHAGGAISEKGNNPSVRVVLPNELSKFDLRTKVPAVEAVKATLELANLCDPTVTWPLIAATLVPLYGPVDFGIHLTGRTGTFKSEVMSLFQSHYGAEMDARHLPGSWSSTANALEAQAFYTANAAFVVDDFIPTGTAWQIRAYQVTADKLFRAQGNQSGRARLTDMSKLQTTMYPRGIILSTGEDTPEGHSVRARMLILELSPGDVEPVRLTVGQKNRALYPGTVAALIQRLAATPVSLTKRADEIRNANLPIGHTRTPGMLGKLIACIEDFIRWAGDIGAIKDGQVKKLQKTAADAILAAGNRQTSYLEATDPTDIFLATVRHALAAGLGHFRTVNGGIPAGAGNLGWSEETSSSDMPLWKSRGPTLGWVDTKEDELFLDITSGYNIVKKAAGNELTLTKQTLFKRLKDAGQLIRVDEARQRNTIRVTADGHPRQVLALSMSNVLDTQEKVDGDE